MDGSLFTDFVLGGAVTVFLLGYLLYALVNPEKF